MAYEPSLPFNVPLILLIPKKVTVKGVLKKYYPEEGELIFGSFRTFGGTEHESNSTLVVENTAVIETWFRPDIKSDCAIKTEDGMIYDIVGPPEDIEKRHKYLKFKVSAVRGGA